jgi:hypothetical protein
MRNSDCRTENGFAIAVGKGREREMGGVALSFFDFFLATLERNHSCCLLKVFILIVYIIIIKLKILLDKK